MRYGNSTADELHITLENYKGEVNLPQNLTIPDRIFSVLLDIWGIWSGTARLVGHPRSADITRLICSNCWSGSLCAALTAPDGDAAAPNAQPAIGLRPQTTYYRGLKNTLKSKPPYII